MRTSLEHVRFDRRSLLLAGSAAVVLAACRDAGSAATDASVSSSSPSSSTSSSASSSTGAASVAATDVAASGSTAPDGIAAVANGPLVAADFDGLATCMLMAEKTAGPFPLDEQFDRRDITEGYPGHPLRLGLRIVDETCTPVPGAVAEIWHTDATGDYSAFADGGGGKDEAEGTTFLRGSQTADEAGIVEFLTLYPGWYSGRAVHIHMRVHVDDATVLTTQLFFDEQYTESVYAAEPYADNGLPDTSIASDSIAGDAAAEGSLLSPVAAETDNGTGSLGLLNVGIDPSARSTGGAGAGGAPPPRP